MFARKRHQNEQLRIPSQVPHVESSPHYNQDCRSPTESRPTATAYHKPTREKPQGFTSFSKVPAKHRGNLRKTRAQYGLQRNNATVQPPRAYVQPQVLSRTVINPNVYTDQQTTNTNRNGSNLISNNQHPINQTTTNNHNIQRNETQFSQTQQCGKSSKKHHLKHATREQDQARATIQVVRWLEREFSQNAAASSGRKHVHEHIHHHYHHYHTEALVWFVPRSRNFCANIVNCFGNCVDPRVIGWRLSDLCSSFKDFCLIASCQKSVNDLI